MDGAAVAAIRSHSDGALGIGVTHTLDNGGLTMTLANGHKTANLETAVEAAGEAEARHAGAQRESDSQSKIAAEKIATLLQHIAGSSVQGIEQLIGELQTLSDVLHDEGARVEREVAAYARLSQSALQSTKVIAESLGTWKRAGGWSARTAAH